jgi:acetoacetyl-CoA reductase
MTKLALVTGGTRGIGAAIAKDLKAAGHRVIANYATNHQVAEAFTLETGIPALAWNVASYAECQQAIAKLEAEHGGIDVLVNNAGITRDSAFHKMAEDDWDSVLDINLKSCFNLCRAVIDGMRTRNYGRIVNISSINAQAGQFGQANYAAAKAGMIGFTKALALEGARKGITVNCVAPGYISTEMVSAINPEILKQIVDKIPVGRLGAAEEVAKMVTFLVAENAGFITGATFSVNGGQHRL